MLPAEGGEILRVAILSGVIGFACFCVSYGFYVWRKRNAAHQQAKSLPIRLAQFLALIGCATIALSWALNEFRGRAGIAGGSNVFVVTARPDISAQQITSADRIAQGAVVAEFLTPADRTRLAAVDLQRSQAQAKKEAIQSTVLQSDEALLQEQTHLRSELLQLKGFAFQLQHSRYEAERERASLTTAWTREESKLLEDTAAAERDYAAALGRREITHRALQRGHELEKQGNFSRQELDVRSADDLAAELAVTKGKQSIAALQERRGVLSARILASLSSLDHQILELTSDHAGLTTSIAEFETQIDRVRADLASDRTRAVISRQREVEAVDYDITILAEEKKRLTEIGQVRAPFSGRVIYRHPAPGLASGNSPMLVISAGAGFTANIRLPRSEVDELASMTEPVKLALESPVLHQFFTGRFVRAEAVPFEPERVIAQLDCSLPPEIIGYLGSSADPVRVRLLWRPALVRQPGFLLGLVLLGASALFLAAAAMRKNTQRPRDRRTGATRISAPDPIRVSRDAPPRPYRASARQADRSSVTVMPDTNDAAR
jgi:hypothetical protein